MRALLALLTLTTIACAPLFPVPLESPHPSPERIAELLALPVANAQLPPPLDFRLKIYPAFVFAGGAAWLSCFVPESYGPGRIRLLFEGTGLDSERPIEFIERRVLLERIPCGSWRAVCAIATARGVERRELTLESRGDCNGGAK